MRFLNAIGILISLAGVFLPASLAMAQINQRAFSNRFDFSEDQFSGEEGKLEAIWRARLYGESTQLETQGAEIGGFDAFLESKYVFAPQLEARVFLRGKFEAGRSQSFFGDLEPANGLLLREAAVRYMPFSVLDFKVGVISQDWMDMPVLTFRQAFLGIQGGLVYDWNENIQTGYIVQQMIPTSQTLSARTVGQEATPSFSTHTLYGQWRDDALFFKLSGSLYQYDKLPSYVAFESQKRGNSVSIIGGPNNSSFSYEFKGWFTQVVSSYRVNSLIEPVVGYSVIKNEKAPETYNDGQVIYLGLKFHTEDLLWGIGYENYFAESDVVPGYYNAWAYGNTNKKGSGGELMVAFKKKNFRIRAQYYEAKVLNVDPLQQDQKYFYLGVETGYDTI